MWQVVRGDRATYSTTGTEEQGSLGASMAFCPMTVRPAQRQCPVQCCSVDQVGGVREAVLAVGESGAGSTDGRREQTGRVGCRLTGERGWKSLCSTLLSR